MRLALVAAVLLAGLSHYAEAALFDRGDGMIYDDVLDITWLQDASFGGVGEWEAASRWAQDLVYAGYDDWRLPYMDRDDDDFAAECAYEPEPACRDNELGYLYYYYLAGSGDMTGDQFPFFGIQATYWSDSHWGAEGKSVFYFEFETGYGGVAGVAPSNIFGAWAVRSGDVAVVPLPAGVWLLASALFALAARRTRALSPAG